MHGAGDDQHLLALGGPFHGEHVRMPSEWHVLPDWSGAYRRIRAPDATHDVLLHETEPESRLHHLYASLRHAPGAIRSVAARDVSERERTEARLRASEASYRDLIDATSAVTWTCPPSGRHVAPQPQWMAFTGQSAEEMVGDGWARAIHPDDREAVVARWTEAVSSGQPFVGEHRVRRHDGEYRWTRVHAVPTRDDTGSIVEWIGMHVDATEERRARDVLRAAHDTFRHLVEQSPFGVYAVDADFRLVQVSTGAQKVFEHVPPPLLGRDFAEVLRIVWPEPFASEAIARFRHTLASGEPYHAPSTVEQRQDTEEVEAYDWKVERVVLPDGRPGVVCHFYDLSERLHYERALREREEQLRQAMDAADAGSWMFVPETGEFHASDRALELHGIPPGTAMTHELALAPVHPDDRGAVEAAFDRAVEQHAPFRSEHRITLPDGTVRWVASHAEHRDDTTPPRLVGLVQDISVRKQAEQLLRAQQAEEHETALTLQRALLPPRLPRQPFVQVGARYAASSQGLEVGGDWYDAIPLEGGRIAFTVGDVVGHGLAAAAAMGQLRTALSALSPRCTPAELLDELDAYVARTRVTEFATVVYAVYDPVTGNLEHASAGHLPMLAVSPDGRMQRLDDATSPPLFGQPLRDRPQSSVVLEPGTLLVLYSDGLVERRGEPFDAGLQRLETAVQRALAHSVDAVCSAVTNALGGHSQPTDDVVILAARVALAAPGQLRLVAPAAAEHLDDVRSAILAWLASHDVPPCVDVDDVLLAVAAGIESGEEPRLLTLTIEGTGDGRARVDVGHLAAPERDP